MIETIELAAADIDCQIADTIGCSSRLYHCTVIVRRQGPNEDSNKPIKNLLAKTGGMVQVKARPKTSWGVRWNLGSKFLPLKLTPVQTTMVTARILPTGKRRMI